MGLYQPESSEETVQLHVKHQQPEHRFTLAGTQSKWVMKAQKHMTNECISHDSATVKSVK